jgi:transcription elongation factor Elf1
MMENGIYNYKEPIYDIFTCDECGEEAVAYPDPTLDLSNRHNHKLAHCFHCWTMHSVSECAKCHVIYEICANVDGSWQQNQPQQMQISNNNDQSFEEDGDFDGFCDNCSDWIEDQ